jgi:hypothetical protein
MSKAAYFCWCFGAIDHHESSASFHELLRGFERRSNQNLAVILFGLPNSDDGDSHNSPNRADCPPGIWRGSPPPRLHGGLGEAGDRIRMPERAAVCCLAGYDQVSAKLSG